MEQALVFASIIVGLAVGDEIVSLHRLLRARAVVRWDWAPLAVALLVMLTLVQVWWAVAQPAGDRLSIGGFLPILVQLVLLVLLASAVLPDAVPDEGIDLAAYYDADGRYIWTLFALSFGWAILASAAGAASTFEGFVTGLAQRIGEIAILGVMIGLALTRDRRWHVAGLVILSLGPLGWLSRTLG